MFDIYRGHFSPLVDYPALVYRMCPIRSCRPGWDSSCANRRTRTRRSRRRGQRSNLYYWLWMLPLSHSALWGNACRLQQCLNTPFSSLQSCRITASEARDRANFFLRATLVGSLYWSLSSFSFHLFFFFVLSLSLQIRHDCRSSSYLLRERWREESAPRPSEACYWPRW